MTQPASQSLAKLLSSHDAEQRRIIDAAIEDLIGHERFAHFISEVISLRELSLSSLEEIEVIKNERATLCAIAEAAAFKKLIDIYTDKRAQFLARVAQEREREAEAAMEP